MAIYEDRSVARNHWVTDDLTNWVSHRRKRLFGVTLYFKKSLGNNTFADSKVKQDIIRRERRDSGKTNKAGF